MNILVTGANGQLGKEFITRFGDNGFNFLGLTSTNLDITDHKEVASRLHFLQPDVVINCAAYTAVDQAEDEPDKARQINADAVENLAICCSDIGAKLVHFSTDYVFPGYPSDRKLFPNGYPENQPPEPLNTYGQTKLEGEKALWESDAEYLIIRVAWLCGQYGQNFVTKMLELAQANDTLQVVDDQWGSPTFTKNVVENTLTLIEENAEGVFHINSQGVINWYQFAQKIFDLAKVDITLEKVSSTTFQAKAERPAFSKLDTAKLESIPAGNIILWEKGLRQLLKEIT